MTAYRIIVPADLDGSFDVWQNVQAELALKFGGCTSYTANGRWHTERAHIFVVEATRIDNDPTVAAGDWTFMRTLAATVKAQLNQTAVYISHRPENGELV